MDEVQPEVLSDIIMWNGLDKTRDEISRRVNETHGTDLSARDVGDAINDVESRAEEQGAREVYYTVHGRGLGVSIGSDLALAFAGAE